MLGRFRQISEFSTTWKYSQSGHTNISIHTSCRSETSSKCLVVLDKYQNQSHSKLMFWLGESDSNRVCKQCDETSSKSCDLSVTCHTSVEIHCFILVISYLGEQCMEMWVWLVLEIFPSRTKWDVRSLLTWPVLTRPDLNSASMTWKYPILNFRRETLLNITRKKNIIHYWRSWILPDITKLLYCQTGMFTGWTKLCLVMR